LDWEDNKEQAGFRTKVKSVIEAKLPSRYKKMSKEFFKATPYRWAIDRNSDNVNERKDAEEWFNSISEEGWVAPHWPKEFGGGGFSPMEQYIYIMQKWLERMYQQLVVM
jgi:alkylation response protein AidB-like acyl-CoA dehydrogenase